MSLDGFVAGPGPWNRTNPWKGWWGETPPFHHPVFVLTHQEREPLVMKGGTTFTFVTDGIERAQQYLDAGLVDEMQLHMVPTLLGRGRG